MLAEKNLYLIVNKIFSGLVFLSVVLMVAGCFLDEDSFDKMVQGSHEMFKRNELISFDRGKVLQCLVILLASFRSDDEILTVFELSGKKDVKEMKKFTFLGVCVYLAAGMIFGSVYNFRHHDKFGSEEINLGNGFFGYRDNPSLINCVILLQIQLKS